MTQNTSFAVMAQNHTPPDDLSFFPTPPWATRALIEYVIGRHRYCQPAKQTCWEPACGDGAMSRPLEEYFGRVISSDIYDYGYGFVRNFLDPQFSHVEAPDASVDWIITNPPFNQGLEFVRTGLRVANIGVAVLLRSVWIEGVERNRFFDQHPLTYLAPFAERVPMVKGRLDRKASTATAYSWFVWIKGDDGGERLKRIPPCRRELDRGWDWPETTGRS